MQEMYIIGFYLFCPGDLVTHAGEWEIQSVSGRVGIDAMELLYAILQKKNEIAPVQLICVQQCKE